MSSKVAIPKIKTAATPTPPVQKKFGGSRPFVDQPELQSEESDTEILQRSGLTPPPPNNGRNNFISSGYNFGQVAIEQHTAPLQPKSKGIIHRKSAALQPNTKVVPETIRRKATKGAFAAPDNVVQAIRARKGRGIPLPIQTKEFFESRFENDFSQVRVHTDSQAVQLSQDLSAQAFTHGNDIYFNKGRFSPDTIQGKTLLAHELTHTIQQTGPKILRRKPKPQTSEIQPKLKPTPTLARSPLKIQTELMVGAPNDKHEIEADQMADHVMRMTDSSSPIQTAAIDTQAVNLKPLAATIQRQENAEEISLKPLAENIQRKYDEGISLQPLAENIHRKYDEGISLQPLAENIHRKYDEGISLKPLSDTIQRDYDHGVSLKPLSDTIQRDVTEDQMQQLEKQGNEAKDKDDKEKEAAAKKVTEQSESFNEGAGQKDDTEKEKDEKDKQQENKDDQEKNKDENQVQIEGQETSKDTGNEDTAKTLETTTTSKDIGKPPTVQDYIPSERSPRNPDEDPAFQDVTGQTEWWAEYNALHKPSDTKSNEAQNSAEDANQQMRSAENTQVGAAGDKNPNPFNKEAFIEALLARLNIVKPKTLGEADSFAKSGALGGVKTELDGQIAEQKKTSGGGLPETINEPPNPNVEAPKEVTPLPSLEGEIGQKSPTVEAEKAIPKAKTQNEIEQPLQETADQIAKGFGLKEKIDAKLEVGSNDSPEEQEADNMANKVMSMSDATPSVQRSAYTPSIQRNVEIEVPVVKQPEPTEAPINVDKLEKLEKGGPEFGATDALGSIKDHREFATDIGPKEYRQQEEEALKAAKEQNITLAQQKNEEIFNTRTSSMTEVEGSQVTTKTEDEAKRLEITNSIQEIYDKTQTKVNTILAQLDEEVNAEFTKGTNIARAKFEQHVARRMAEYKRRRYWKTINFGFFKIRVFDIFTWIGDKLFGMPDEVNKFYEEGKQLYIDEITKSITIIAGMVEKRLTEAKATVDAGRQEVKDHVAGLDENLKQIGQQAAADIENKFKALETSIYQKQAELIDTLAKKYEEKIAELDKRIEELKAKNEGLVQKALKFIASVVAAVLKFILIPLKAVLKLIPGIGELAAQIIDAIIDDPVGFLKNFFKGIGDGFKNFFTNIDKHLPKGIITWLFGNIPGGIKLPDKFDIKGFFDIILQALGLSKEYIFGLAEQALGFDIVSIIRIFVEKGANALDEGAQELMEGLTGAAKLVVDFFIKLITEGPIGIWNFLVDAIDTIKGIFMGDLSLMISIEVIKAAITWVIGLLSPATGLIKIVKAIIDIIIWFIDNLEQIKALITAIGEGIKALIKGLPQMLAVMVELALANAIPIVIGLFISLLGLGGFPSKIQKLFTKLRAPIDKTIGAFFKKVSGFFKGVKKKAKSKYKNSRFGKKDKKDKKNTDNALTRAKAASKQAFGIVKQTRDPKEVEESKLNPVKSQHKLTTIKVSKPLNPFKRDKEYTIKATTKQIVQKKESKWKDPKNKVIVDKPKVSGSKKKASISIDVKLMSEEDVLKNFIKEIKPIIYSEPSQKTVKKHLDRLKKKYELKDVSIDPQWVKGVKKQGFGDSQVVDKYLVKAIAPPPDQTTAQRKAKGEANSSLDGVERAIKNSLGKGQPIQPAVRQPMEQAFGQGFGGVRIHTDSNSDRLNRSLNSEAFTTGQDIFFRSGSYQPVQRSGQKLLAHELTHVVQQSNQPSSNFVQRMIIQRLGISDLGGTSGTDIQEDVDISSRQPNKTTAELKVKVEEKTKTTEKKPVPKEKAQPEGLSDATVNDIVKIIQQIVNDEPNRESVQQKLDKVRVDFGLDLLNVITYQTSGQDFTYTVKIKGTPTKDSSEISSSTARDIGLTDNKPKTDQPKDQAKETEPEDQPKEKTKEEESQENSGESSKKKKSKDSYKKAKSRANWKNTAKYAALGLGAVAFGAVLGPGALLMGSEALKGGAFDSKAKVKPNDSGKNLKKDDLTSSQEDKSGTEEEQNKKGQESPSKLQFDVDTQVQRIDTDNVDVMVKAKAKPQPEEAPKETSEGSKNEETTVQKLSAVQPKSLVIQPKLLFGSIQRKGVVEKDQEKTDDVTKEESSVDSEKSSSKKDAIKKDSKPKSNVKRDRKNPNEVYVTFTKKSESNTDASESDAEENPLETKEQKAARKKAKRNAHLKNALKYLLIGLGAIALGGLLGPGALVMGNEALKAGAFDSKAKDAKGKKKDQGLSDEMVTKIIKVIQPMVDEGPTREVIQAKLDKVRDKSDLSILQITESKETETESIYTIRIQLAAQSDQLLEDEESKPQGALKTLVEEELVGEIEQIAAVEQTQDVIQGKLDKIKPDKVDTLQVSNYTKSGEDWSYSVIVEWNPKEESSQSVSENQNKKPDDEVEGQKSELETNPDLDKQKSSDPDKTDKNKAQKQREQLKKALTSNGENELNDKSQTMEQEPTDNQDQTIKKSPDEALYEVNTNVVEITPNRVEVQVKAKTKTNVKVEEMSQQESEEIEGRSRSESILSPPIIGRDRSNSVTNEKGEEMSQEESEGIKGRSRSESIINRPIIGQHRTNSVYT